MSTAKQDPQSAPVPRPATSQAATARLARVLLVVFPRLLGALFLLTGTQKILSLSGLLAVLKFDGLPTPLLVPVAYTVIAAELVLGLLLVLLPRRGVLIAATVLLAVFSIQIGYLLAFKEAPSCACLEAHVRFENARRTNALSLMRNLLLILPLLWMLLINGTSGTSRASS